MTSFPPWATHTLPITSSMSNQLFLTKLFITNLYLTNLTNLFLTLLGPIRYKVHQEDTIPFQPAPNQAAVQAMSMTPPASCVRAPRHAPLLLLDSTLATGEKPRLCLITLWTPRLTTSHQTCRVSCSQGRTALQTTPIQDTQSRSSTSLRCRRSTSHNTTCRATPPRRTPCLRREWRQWTRHGRAPRNHHFQLHRPTMATCATHRLSSSPVVYHGSCTPHPRQTLLDHGPIRRRSRPSPIGLIKQRTVRMGRKRSSSCRP